MTTLAVPAVPVADADARESVVRTLGGLGEPVDLAGVRSLPLEGRHVLWLVAAGVLDLFAMDSDQHGRWHFLGRIEAGSVLPVPVRGPRHTLVGRPLEGCVMRRIPLRDLIRVQRDEWVRDRPAQGLSPQEDALVRGIDLALQVTIDSTLDRLPPRDFVPLEPGRDIELRAGQCGRSVDGIAWIEVVSGRLQVGSTGTLFRDREAGDLVTISELDWITCDDDGAVVTVRSTRDLLAAGVLWQHLTNHEARFLFTLDRWIERLDRAHEERMAAGRKAGEAVRAHADHALLAVVDLAAQTPAEAAEPGETAALAAIRLVAEAAAIAVVPPPEGEAGQNRLGMLERVAVTSRFRTREVKLGDGWWRENVGPLLGRRLLPTPDGEKAGPVPRFRPVALLWRRGGYHVVDPATSERFRLTGANADLVVPMAYMFYRPLPEKPVPAWRLLLFGLQGTRTDLRGVIVGVVVAVALGAVVPIATGQVLGVFVPSADRSLIVQTSIALVLAAVVAAAFMLLENLSVLRMEGRLDATLQAAVWDRLLRLPATFFTSRSTGELASAALGVSGIRRVLSGVTSVAIQACVVGAVNFVVLLFYSVPLTFVAVALLAVSGLLFMGLGLRRMRWQRRMIELDNKLNNRAFQTLRGLPKLRVAAAESFAYAHWATDFVMSRELRRRVGRMQNLVTVFNAVYLPFCTLAIFLLLSGPARGSLSVSGFLTFNVAVAMMLGSMVQLTGAVTSAITVVPLFQQLKPILREIPEVREASTVPADLSGEIEVNHLSFRYAEDGPLVLDDVSFRILPGEFVAVVGGSGCGKSTLLRLLIGFNEPTSGTVLYDGQDLSGLDQGAVRRQCGVVLQNAQPFTGTILDCICGAQRFTLDEAWEAAEMAGLAEDLNRMPMGMHTVISDGGGTLSGGQRQRLMIAQALIRRPRILFFDEATSALDNETQRIVTESTRKLHATRVVIAHRLSTIMDADRVIVMDTGRVVQQGTPADLRADTSGMFHQLVRRQMK